MIVEIKNCNNCIFRSYDKMDDSYCNLHEDMLDLYADNMDDIKEVPDFCPLRKEEATFKLIK